MGKMFVIHIPDWYKIPIINTYKSLYVLCDTEVK